MILTRTILAVCISVFSCMTAVAQDLYDMATIQTLEITMAESNWDQLLDNAYPSGEYILATAISINGTVYDSVGVKYKGNSTYRATQTKNPWHIELDTYKDHEHQGYTDIKLSNIAKDPSFIREVLSYQILRQYMDAPLSNYANVYVNGELIGLYSNSEAVSKKFVDKRFGSKNNTFVKCNPPAGAGPQTSDFPDLRYLGNDSTAYYDAYEIKSDHGWAGLINLCGTLANEPAAIETVLDVDRALWMLAYNNALVNLDSYIGGFKQNYYLYSDDNGRFLPVVWDLNESFGKFAMSGAGNLNSTNAKISMDPFLHENSSQWPLVSQLLAVPQYRRKYVAHYKTILEENFANGSYYDTAIMLQSVIDEAVQADPNKLFSYNNFLTNLDSDIGGMGGGGGGGGGSTPGIAPLMDSRASYVLGQAEFVAEAPAISGVQASPAQPVVGGSVDITSTIAAANEVYLSYRTDGNAPFASVQMYDDGQHNDGAAGDGIYGATITVTNVTTQYYIYADGEQAGMFSPQRAEHEFHTLIATSTSISDGDLVINELLASNDATTADQDGEYDDWIELYNNGEEAIDLTDYSLSDDPENPSKWVFPSETSIAAGGYLMIWADDDEDQSGLHASFKLSAGGESVVLYDTAGEVIDEVTYLEQTTDVSYGRYPNGTGAFQTMQPTFGSENSNTTNTTDLDGSEILLSPNPVSDELLISGIPAKWHGTVGKVLTPDGQLVTSFVVSQSHNVLTQSWPSGLYFVSIGTESSKVVKL